jgi:hypothetical protein
MPNAEQKSPPHFPRLPRIHGPIVRPFIDLDGRESGEPTHPGTYARYLPIDLDANNRHSIEEWEKRFPDREHVPFGWGVCRQGFGLQDLPPLSEETAREFARRLNRATPIGAIEPAGASTARLDAVKTSMGITH